MDLELMQKKGTNKTTGESKSTDPTAQNTSRTAFLIKVMDAYCKTMLYCNICIQADKQVYFIFLYAKININIGKVLLRN